MATERNTENEEIDDGVEFMTFEKLWEHIILEMNSQPKTKINAYILYKMVYEPIMSFNIEIDTDIIIPDYEDINSENDDTTIFPEVPNQDD